MGYKAEVLAEGKWTGNGMVFATKKEAEDYGRDLLARWFVPTDSRAVQVNEPVNYSYTDRQLVRL